MAEKSTRNLKNPHAGEVVAKIERFFGFSVRGDSSNEVTSGYYFDFHIDSLHNANSWVCQELVFNEDQLSRLQGFALPADGFVGRVGYHKNIGPCIAVAERSRVITVKSLVRGGLWEYKKADVEWFDGPVDLSYALGEVERLNCSNGVE